MRRAGRQAVERLISDERIQAQMKRLFASKAPESAFPDIAAM
jgi:hypothetical protein